MELYDLCPHICEALKECTTFDYDHEQAVYDTMDLLSAGDLSTIYDFLYSFVEDLSEDDRPIFYPVTMEVLEELAHFGEME